MKKIDSYIFKEHLVPFILSLLVLLFILLANFLLKSIDKFLGKGLNLSVLLEYVFYNMAWIMALAVPMAVLIATLSAFGRFSSDNEITAMKATGISTFNLLRAPLLFAFIVACIMIYFNNIILPDMNHQARSLSVNMSKKRPDLQFAEGVFTEAIPNYSIYVDRRENIKGKNIFFDINIFNNRENSSQRTITASSGTLGSMDDGIILHLKDGQIHEIMNEGDDYTIIDFTSYDVAVPIDNMALNRKNLKSRGDREMTYSMMIDKIGDLKAKKSKTENRITDRILNESSIDVANIQNKNDVDKILDAYKSSMLDSLQAVKNPKLIKSFKRKVKNLKRGINNDFRLITNYQNSINKYLVELHKKFSIPVASIAFVLIGAPIGIMSRRGNFALSTTVGLVFFIIYWIFLIAGEQLADRGAMSPALSMWLPNIVLSLFGCYLIYINSIDRKKIKFEMFNLFFKKKSRKTQ